MTPERFAQRMLELRAERYRPFCWRGSCRRRAEPGDQGCAAHRVHPRPAPRVRVRSVRHSPAAVEPPPPAPLPPPPESFTRKSRATPLPWPDVVLVPVEVNAVSERACPLCGAEFPPDPFGALMAVHLDSHCD